MASILDKGWNNVDVNFNDVVGMGNVARGYLSEAGNILDRYQNRRLEQEKNDLARLNLAEQIRQFGINSRFNEKQLAQNRELAYMREDRADARKQAEWNREDQLRQMAANAEAEWQERATGRPYARLQQQVEELKKNNPALQEASKQSDDLRALLNNAIFTLQENKNALSNTVMTPEESKKEKGEYLQYQKNREELTKLQQAAELERVNPPLYGPFVDQTRLNSLQKNVDTYEQTFGGDILNRLRLDSNGNPISDSRTNPRVLEAFGRLNANITQKTKEIEDLRKAFAEAQQRKKTIEKSIESPFQAQLDDLNPGFTEKVVRDENGNPRVVRDTNGNPVLDSNGKPVIETETTLDALTAFNNYRRFMAKKGFPTINEKDPNYMAITSQFNGKGTELANQMTMENLRHKNRLDEEAKKRLAEAGSAAQRVMKQNKDVDEFREEANNMLNRIDSATTSALSRIGAKNISPSKIAANLRGLITKTWPSYIPTTRNTFTMKSSGNDLEGLIKNLDNVKSAQDLKYLADTFTSKDKDIATYLYSIYNDIKQ